MDRARQQPPSGVALARAGHDVELPADAHYVCAHILHQPGLHVLAQLLLAGTAHPGAPQRPRLPPGEPCCPGRGRPLHWGSLFAAARRRPSRAPHPPALLGQHAAVQHLLSAAGRAALSRRHGGPCKARRADRARGRPAGGVPGTGRAALRGSGVDRGALRGGLCRRLAAPGRHQRPQGHPPELPGVAGHLRHHTRQQGGPHAAAVHPLRAAPCGLAGADRALCALPEARRLLGSAVGPPHALLPGAPGAVQGLPGPLWQRACLRGDPRGGAPC
mmetsp:Transcript_67283/g.186411  ORF Transcript_67283/g.186411 Transcript_67283/m.186411 type:complete len:274 (-) Transcript_67283:229-1050(-)